MTDEQVNYLVGLRQPTIVAEAVATGVLLLANA
jgi:hypothetical protein